MSIKQIAKCKNPSARKYRQIVSEIYSKYEDLYKIMETYAIYESCAYIELAYKCFEKEVGKDFDRHQC